jgi:death-on-curing protein
MNPVFLSVGEVLKIHSRQLAKDGGMDGVRDPNLLESAVMQPMATFGGQFLHDDLFLMAAAYLFHLVKNHPFLDGNKRTGFLSAVVFLKLNGVNIADPNPLLYDATMAVAEGRLDKEGLASIFRDLSGSKG